ncbi:MAG: hypothetical protein HY298_18545 [Verrucomicrobia bacterium]|nr:hypothetical protein [Verrucomicrobiota bacterium]
MILLLTIVTTLITISGCIVPVEGRHGHYRSHERFESHPRVVVAAPVVVVRPPEIIVR